MGELYSSEGYSYIHSTETCEVLLNCNLLQPHFSSYVSIDGIFSRLLTLTSYIKHRLIQFIEDLIFRDVRRWSENSVVISCNQEERCACYCANTSATDGTSTSSRPCYPSTSLSVNQECTSIKPPVNSEFAIVESNYISGGIHFILKGLLLPIFGLRIARRLALTTWTCTLCYLTSARDQALSIISRVRRTLRGSSDDIGWLQHDPEMAPIEDGSARFLELLEQIRNGEHTLPDYFVYLLIPGLFSNHGPLYFVSTKRHFSKMGLACHIAKIHSEASVEHNAWVLKQYIEELYWGSGKRLMLLGHSKGGVDAAAALSIYQQELKDKVAGLALVQSPYGGTPLPSDILREGQIADRETRQIMELIICKLVKGDIRALEDLTYEKRKEFIKTHKLPENIPLISFHSEASGAPGVIATMSPIAHAELPWLPLPHLGTEECLEVQRKVPVIVPVSAIMALCALHLQLRYGEKSDGLVTCRDAEVPGSVVVKPDRKLDHAWMVYTSWTKNPSEPDCSEMCEAILTLLVELGQRRRYQSIAL